MRLTDIFTVLVKHQALIVHCAGIAKGVGNATTNQLGYLERLESAARNQVELSCSTIIPNDECSFVRMNYTGKVGLILRPKTIESITFASPTDAGSQIDPTRPGRRTHNCGPVNLQAIDTAVSCRPADTYNELGLFDFSVVGIFVDPPLQYSNELGLHDISVEEVALRFPTHKLLCLRRGILYSCAKEGTSWQLGTKVLASEIYQ